DRGGGPASGASAPETVATAIVSNEVLAAYHAEVARRAQARARTATRPKRLRPILPQPALPSAAPDTATLATADAPQDPSQRADATPPANDKGPGAGNSGGSGDDRTSDPRTAGSGRTSPAPASASYTSASASPASASPASASPATLRASDRTSAGGHPDDERRRPPRKACGGRRDRVHVRQRAGSLTDPRGLERSGHDRDTANQRERNERLSHDPQLDDRRAARGTRFRPARR